MPKEAWLTKRLKKIASTKRKAGNKHNQNFADVQDGNLPPALRDPDRGAGSSSDALP